MWREVAAAGKARPARRFDEGEAMSEEKTNGNVAPDEQLTELAAADTGGRSSLGH